MKILKDHSAQSTIHTHSHTYIYIYYNTYYNIYEIYIWNIYIKSLKCLFNEILDCFLQNVLGFLHFRLCQNYKSSVNHAAEVQKKLWVERALNTRESWTCEYVTLLHSFHIWQFCIHLYIKYTLLHSAKPLAYLVRVILI